MKNMNPSKDDITRKKILYRARYRGTKELDLLVGTFVKTHVATADSDELQELQVLLDCPDGALQACLFHGGEVPEEIAAIFPKLLEFSKSYKSG